MKYFDKTNNRLVFLSTKANSKFWDKQWTDKNLKKSILSIQKNNLISKTTKKFIKPSVDKKILEGGCGKGHFVYRLQQDGYSSFGIDYAKKTILEINKVLPSIQVTLGDVRKTQFPNNYFDGYWSLGVIEHFFNGYQPIINEMQRIIKPDGYLFITFPYMSPIRKIKAKLNKYPIFDKRKINKNSFYQFALDPKKVQKDLERLDFILIHKQPFDGIKGLKDEVSLTKNILQKIYDSRNIFMQSIGFILSKFLSPFTGHSILLIFKKNA